MGLIVHTLETSTKTDDRTRILQKNRPSEKPRSSKMVRPIEMSLGASFVLIVLILRSICLLRVFYVRAIKDNGINHQVVNT